MMRVGTLGEPPKICQGRRLPLHTEAILPHLGSKDLKSFTCWPQKRLLVAMSYCPSGPPESQHRDIWVSGKVGDSRSRCIATSLHQKGYDASWQRKKTNRKLQVFRCVLRDLVQVTNRDYHRNIITCNSFYFMI